jgi:hypothetical protein
LHRSPSRRSWPPAPIWSCRPSRDWRSCTACGAPARPQRDRRPRHLLVLGGGSAGWSRPRWYADWAARPGSSRGLTACPAGEAAPLGPTLAETPGASPARPDPRQDSGPWTTPWALDETLGRERRRRHVADRTTDQAHGRPDGRPDKLSNTMRAFHSQRPPAAPPADGGRRSGEDQLTSLRPGRDVGGDFDRR